MSPLYLQQLTSKDSILSAHTISQLSHALTHHFIFPRGVLLLQKTIWAVKVIHTGSKHQTLSVCALLALFFSFSFILVSHWPGCFLVTIMHYARHCCDRMCCPNLILFPGRQILLVREFCFTSALKGIGIQCIPKQTCCLGNPSNC